MNYEIKLTNCCFVKYFFKWSLGEWSRKVLIHLYSGFSQIDKIDNNGNIGIRGFTT